jgi:hypothetical protein
MNFSDYFLKGLRNTLKLKNGVNMSFKGTEFQIPTATVIDTWFIGEFSTATYDIIAEYGHDDVERLTLSVASKVGQTSLVEQGRSNLGKDLVRFTATADASKVTVTAIPYYQADGVTPLVNVKLTLKATYSERIIPAAIPTIVGQSSNTGGQQGIGQNYTGSNLANGFLLFDDSGLIAISNFTRITSPSQSTLTASFILENLNINSVGSNLGITTDAGTNSINFNLNSLKGLTVTSSISATLPVLSSINNVIIGANTAKAGTFTTISNTGAVNLVPYNTNVVISPTSTGTLTVNSIVAGTINNMNIGVTTAGTGRFSALDITVATFSSNQVVTRGSIIPQIISGVI